MQKVVVNRCWGGFGLSHAACMMYAKLAGFTAYPFVEKRDERGNLDFHHFRPFDGKEDENMHIIHYAKAPLNEDGTYVEDSYWYPGSLKRDDPILVQVVEKMGKAANGALSELEIVRVPNGVKWVIEDYDGMETVEEEHRSW